jgi:hypothetical protein
MTKLERAFEKLLKRMDEEGAEFPDKVFEVSIEFKVDEKRLTEMYDQWCMS